MDDPLHIFHPLIARWFAERMGKPTPIQSLAWQRIAAGSHVLAVAPTGTGKTLAAFLWAIDRLVTGAWKAGAVRVLYISPLKALNNDIRRNLLAPLGELGAQFAQSGAAFPEIRVLTRSGDTPSEERRALYRHPPEILITTPESLNIMLTSRSGRDIFHSITTVILDEIHALAGTKRGTHLITAVERLTLTSGEFQRIALSATVNPVEEVAAFVGGYELIHPGDGGSYRKRPVAILRAADAKRYDVAVVCPPGSRDENEEDLWWRNLVDELKETIRANRSTLIFTKSRRAAEKMARFLNEGEEEIVAYSHHGSIAREIRLEVEERMKRGELKAIVATNSLELGIDIGELDEVILVETPFSISSSLQRLGRAGHGVGRTSSGRLYPTHGLDFVSAAVMARSVREKSVEPLRPVTCPLDVLAQVIVSMTSVEQWDRDALYAFLKTCWPYYTLTRRQYDLVLEMLAGRYADSRLKELLPRVSVDKIDNTVRARSGAAYLLYTSGGTIPDRGYYDLRLQDTRAKIGELDEEFVWERRVGDTFTLGTQIWRIQNITHNDVEVLPLRAAAGMVPFWRAEEVDRDFHYAGRIMAFLKDADAELPDGIAFKEKLAAEYAMRPEAADALADFLERQREAMAGKLPHRGRIVLEHYRGGSSRTDGRECVVHTFWGGRLNRPFAMALAAAWERDRRVPLEVYTGDDGILLILPDGADVAGILRAVTPENLDELLRSRLESTGYFGAHFRENAARALLLPRASFHRRYPLWLARLRAKRLLEVVARYADFPIVLETWRECLQDAFDLPNLKAVLGELHAGLIEIAEVENDEPSPFCDGLIWRQMNKYVYEDDTPESRRPSGLSRGILDEVLHSSRLRPRIPPHLVAELEGRLQRVAPGYAPADPLELLDWLKERLLIPLPEWDLLLAACRRDAADFPAELPEKIAGKIVTIRPRGAAVAHACARENLALVAGLLGGEEERRTLEAAGRENGITRAAVRHRHGEEVLTAAPKDTDSENTLDAAGFLVQWLSYYGPMTRTALGQRLGMRGDELTGILAELAEEGRIIVDAIREGAGEEEVCHTDNLERLLRMARRARQPAFTALPVDCLPLFLASWQGVARPGETLADLQERMEKLFGFAAEAPLWEEAILPARMGQYRPAWLDGLLNATPLRWIGAGREKILFALEDEAGLFVAPPERDLARARLLFPHDRGAYQLFDIARHAGVNTEEVTRQLWDLAWKSAVVNDAMETLRKGILAGFAASGRDDIGGRPTAAGRRPLRRAAMNRWAASRPLQGNWRLLQTAAPGEAEGIERMELDKERVRILLDRYGILFRELLDREPPLLRWRRLFPVLRLMELSGEITSGCFFEGIPGVQFMSFPAFRFLQDGLDEEIVYWLNAKDPASLCGAGLAGLKGTLPPRHAAHHTVFQGRRLVLVSRRNGRELQFHIPPDHPRLSESLAFCKVLLARDFNPEKGIVVEKINGLPARESPYRETLRAFGFADVYEGLELRRRY